MLALRDDFEFDRYWLGTTLHGPISQDDAMTVKRALHVGVAEWIEAHAPEIRPSLEQCDVRILMHYPELTATVKPKPLLIYGRYLKYSREIPHSKWHCRRCRGRGCAACGGTGRRFLKSVEELAAKPIMAVCGASASKFHTCGREDVDALMLGDGRPFVLELRHPKKRTLDWPALEARINALYPGEIAVRQLQRCDDALCRMVDTLSPDKSYRAVARCLSPAPLERVEALSALRGLRLAQETPRRVLHRRANLTRKRAVRECAVEILKADAGQVTEFALTLRVQSGTYIKEFVSGDQGRTHPSAAALLNVPCDCVELDVLNVHCDPLAEWRAGRE